MAESNVEGAFLQGNRKSRDGQAEATTITGPLGTASKLTKHYHSHLGTAQPSLPYPRSVLPPVSSSQATPTPLAPRPLPAQDHQDHIVFFLALPIPILFLRRTSRHHTPSSATAPPVPAPQRPLEILPLGPSNVPSPCQRLYNVDSNLEKGDLSTTRYRPEGEGGSSRSYHSSNWRAMTARVILPTWSSGAPRVPRSGAGRRRNPWALAL